MLKIHSGDLCGPFVEITNRGAIAEFEVDTKVGDTGINLLYKLMNRNELISNGYQLMYSSEGFKYNHMSLDRLKNVYTVTQEMCNKKSGHFIILFEESDDKFITPLKLSALDKPLVFGSSVPVTNNEIRERLEVCGFKVKKIQTTGKFSDLPHPKYFRIAHDDSRSSLRGLDFPASEPGYIENYYKAEITMTKKDMRQILSDNYDPELYSIYVPLRNRRPDHVGIRIDIQGNPQYQLAPKEQKATIYYSPKQLKWYKEEQKKKEEAAKASSS